MRLNEVSREFGITCNGGSRPVEDITCVVRHQTGGETARSAASYLSTRPDGSVHMCVDEQEAYQTAPRSRIACGVRDVNEWTWHIEQAGPFTRTLKGWLEKWLEVRRCSYHIARILVMQSLPCRYLTAQDFNDGARFGYTDHKHLSNSNISSSTHTDPVNYPTRRANLLIRHYYWRFRHFGVPKLKVVAE